MLPIYSREEDWIANILNNNNPKFQFFLINEKFPLKLLQCILEMVKNESYVLQSFQNDLNKLLSYNNLKLYHGLLNENFYQNLFEELPWEIIIKTIITHYIYDIKFNTSNFDSKVFDYLVKSNKFSNIDWTNIGEDIEVHNFALINKFFDSPETLTQKILQNPTFWKRNWSHILKSMIHDNNSSDSKFYELIRKFSKEILVQQFIRQHHSDLELYEKKYSQD